MTIDAVQPNKTFNLKGRHFLTLADYTSKELEYLLDQAMEIKQQQKNGETYHPLANKTLGMIFEKSSTRTRVSFEVGMYQLGGSALFLSSQDLQLGRGEPISDTAQVLSRYVDGIMIRTFGHEGIAEFAQYATVPVINGLTDAYHPCQAVADLMTILEHKGTLKGLKLAYVGDGNNVAHSLMIGAAKMGMHISVATPEHYECDDHIIQVAGDVADKTGTSIELTSDAKQAVADADVIYTDVWASMGWESERNHRIQAFQPYQVNQELMQYAKDDYIFLHCLPAHRGEEVTADIIDGPHSVVFDEAENRLHVQKAIMAELIG